MATNHTTGNGPATTPPLDISGALDAINDASYEMEAPLFKARGLAKVLYLAAGEEDIEEYVTDALRTTINCLEDRLKEIDACFTAIRGGLRSIVVTAEETRGADAPRESVTALIDRLGKADDNNILSESRHRAGQITDDESEAAVEEFVTRSTVLHWAIIDTKATTLWEVALKLRTLRDVLTAGTNWADSRDLKMLASATDDLERLHNNPPTAADGGAAA